MSYTDRTAHITDTEYDRWQEQFNNLVDEMSEELKLSQEDATRLAKEMLD